MIFVIVAVIFVIALFLSFTHKTIGIGAMFFAGLSWLSETRTHDGHAGAILFAAIAALLIGYRVFRLISARCVVDDEQRMASVRRTRGLG